MPIHYALFENHLTSDPDDYMALVQAAGTAYLNDVIDRMMQVGSTITRADVAGTLEDFFAAIEYLMLEGQNVNTPLVNFRASIKGVFESQNDVYDPARHQLAIAASPGKRLRKTVTQQGQVSKKTAVSPVPTLQTFTDIATNMRNGTVTPGGMGQIGGHRLKFDATDPNQGIFFIDASRTATQVAVVGRNVPAELLFLIPAGLAPGNYTLEVRAVFGKSDLRRGQLNKTLQVL